MKRAGFSVLIIPVTAPLAVISVMAQMSISTLVSPFSLRILQFPTDHVEIGIVALILAMIGFCLLKGLGRLRCWVR